ncbi:hypothetical protein TPHA_0J00380 [Tetrapisispora phaffii CBS 4417]|uniref:Cyclin-like domain-containing protein n=1 Tax=Tetrapisispora phaffii (strain ATCC 24235 / CBS 4417 / NBRC 1672 / NRRL Y-8282 / UCD 70-5) TaxID=1071381 RepID=G8BYB9_TETPH|nr:hypothetical protein TPHA_0J00380 [Tetrapisispora phaffii CBS 4417]CCE64861.1 hypothetical protein TPHA_0J00380 [Tetrapisispora phaffii CBS 4417]
MAEHLTFKTNNIPNICNNTNHNDSDNNNDENIETIMLPTSFLKCSRSDLVVLISRMLTFLIQINDRNEILTENNSAMIPTQTDVNNKNNNNMINLTRFHSRVPPNISVNNYLIRLTKYASLEHSVLLSSLYYIDLLSSVYPEFKINSLTVHRFLLAATTVASKGLSDSFCTNSHYAKVGGVRCSELNILETDFLRRINYRIIPRDDNIKLCKLEKKSSQFTLDLGDLLAANIQPELTHPNSGYNVLNIYYRKMVQIVGLLKNSTDKSKKVNYIIQTNYNDTNISDIDDNRKVIQIYAQHITPQKRNYDDHVNILTKGEQIQQTDKSVMSKPEDGLPKVPKYSPEYAPKYNILNSNE